MANFFNVKRLQVKLLKLLKRLQVLRSFKVYLELVMVVTSITATTALALLTTTTITTDVYGQTAGMATLQNIKATYAVEIVPGAAQKTNLIHYYPPAIAVPLGTAVGWYNNDPEQPHTVTSGLPGASDSGTLLILALCQPQQIHSFNIRLTELAILYTIVRYIHGELQ